MAYTHINFKTKKSLKEAVASEKAVTVFQPGLFGPHVEDGPVSLEGPHFPEPHRWYAQAMVKNGTIIPGTVK